MAEPADGGGKGAKAKKGAKAAKRGEGAHTKKFKKRNAKEEHVDKPARARFGFHLPSVHIGLGAKVLIGLVCAIEVRAAILYPAGQTYYHAMRDEQRLQAEYDAVQARNKAIEEQNEALQTDEGIETAAREKDGYTKDGEVSVVVTNPGETHENSSTIPKKVDKDSITAPVTWYHTVLDAMFFYDNKPASG